MKIERVFCFALVLVAGCNRHPAKSPSSEAAVAPGQALGKQAALPPGQSQQRSEKDPPGAQDGRDGGAPDALPQATGNEQKDPGEVVALTPLPAAVIDAGFRMKSAELTACYERVAARNPWMTGVLELKVRVDAAGKVVFKSISKPLGSVDVERCVLGVVGGLSFQTTADAEFTHSFSFRGNGGVEEWDGPKVGEVFAAQRANLDHCNREGLAGGVPPSLQVGLFITAGGVASSVGVGADTVLDEVWSRCVSTEIARWKFPEPPKGRVAHVVYHF